MGMHLCMIERIALTSTTQRTTRTHHYEKRRYDNTYNKLLHFTVPRQTCSTLVFKVQNYQIPSANTHWITKLQYPSVSICSINPIASSFDFCADSLCGP